MTPKIVGILNVTPDSFSDGDKYSSYELAIRHAEQMFKEGADLVDIGGEATNPWAEPVSPKEEWKRVEKIIKKLISSHPNKVSLDTRHPETAENFLKLGGNILNDVSGFRNQKMINLAAAYQPLCIINHFPASTPKEVHELSLDSIETVKTDLLTKLKELVDAGVNKDKIILDPGIGFGKTMRLNQELLEFAKLVPEVPVMIGYSRKRFLGDQRFELRPNLEAAKLAASSGAKYLRVHDVKETVKLFA